jgi:hypothetical protein
MFKNINLILVICLILVLIYIIHRNNKYPGNNIEGFENNNNNNKCKNNRISLYDDLIKTSKTSSSNSDTRLKELEDYLNKEGCFDNQQIFYKCDIDKNYSDNILLKSYTIKYIKNTTLKENILKDIKEGNENKCAKDNEDDNEKLFEFYKLNNINDNKIKLDKLKEIKAINEKKCNVDNTINDDILNNRYKLNEIYNNDLKKQAIISIKNQINNVLYSYYYLKDIPNITKKKETLTHIKTINEERCKKDIEESENILFTYYNLNNLDNNELKKDQLIIIKNNNIKKCNLDKSKSDTYLYKYYTLETIYNDDLRLEVLNLIKDNNTKKCNETNSNCIPIPKGLKFLSKEKAIEYIDNYKTVMEEKNKNKNIDVAEYICKKCKLCEKVEDVCDDDCLDHCNQSCDEIDDNKCEESCEIADNQFKITKEGGQTFLEQKLALMEQHERKRDATKTSKSTLYDTLLKYYTSEEADKIIDNYEFYDVYKIKSILVNMDGDKYFEFTKNELLQDTNLSKNQIITMLKKYDYNDNELDSLLKEYDDKFGIYDNVELSKNTLDVVFGRHFTVKENDYTEYNSETDENRDILDETSYDYKSGWTTVPPSSKSTTTMNIPNLPEFYNMFDIGTLPQMEYSEQRDLPYNGSNSNIYRTYYKPIVNF